MKALLLRATVVALVGIAVVVVVADRVGERDRNRPRDIAARGELALTGATYQDRRWGFTVAVPDGWHRATTSLTPSLVDPSEILAVATFPLAAAIGCAIRSNAFRGRGVRDGAGARPRRLRQGRLSGP